MSPNIFITGSVGTGKSTLSKKLQILCKSQLGIDYEILNLSHIAIEKQFYEEFDEQLDTYVVDEDALYEYLCEYMQQEDKCFIVDYHSASSIPETMIDLIVILHCNTETQYDRLLARKYSEVKIRSNVEAEIMQVVKEEVYEYFGRKACQGERDEVDDDNVIDISDSSSSSDASESNNCIIVELDNNNEGDLSSNLDRIVSWIDQNLN
ncbi:hypothetical protein MP228_010520 [Amoeboaphelidium protococcarum]|nr:hypothetical protein MP228_010520 [Amoeboaphelidium protococcarum]